MERCFLRGAARIWQTHVFIRCASGMPIAAATNAGWVEQMEEMRAQLVRKKAEEREAVKQGQELLRAHSRSSLDGYRGPVTPTIAAYVLQKTRDPFEARAFFDWASKQPGFEHNGDTCAALLSVFLKARLFKNAFAMFTQDLWPLCAHSAVAYSTMVQGYCYVGNMAPALSFLRQMAKMGFHIDVALHNSLLRGLCKAGKADDALDHFLKMEQNGDVDVETYRIIISDLCQQRKTDKALDILYNMNPDCQPDVGIYNTILEPLCELKMNVAYMLFEQMIERGCLPDSVTFALLVRGCFKDGLLEEGSQLLKQMVETGCELDLGAFNAVVEGLCRARRVDNAREVMEEMTKRGCLPNVATHNFLLATLCKLDRLDEVHRHVQRMIASGCLPDTSTYIMLIKKLCKEKKPLEAHRFFKQMVAGGCEPDGSIYNLLLTSHCKASKPTASYAIFKEMIDRGIVPHPEALASLCQLLEKAHRYAEAREVAKVIPDTPLLLN